jgi:hypothetical protein
MTSALTSSPEQGLLVSVLSPYGIIKKFGKKVNSAVSLASQPDYLKWVRRQEFRMRYRADLTAGSIKLRESRVIADLLLKKTDSLGWRDAILERNVLQARSPASAKRLTTLIRGRLGLMGEGLWLLVRDAPGRFPGSRREGPVAHV